MKCLLVFSTALLLALVQVQGKSDAEVTLPRGLLQDIENAKNNMTMLRSQASMMVSTENMVIYEYNGMSMTAYEVDNICRLFLENGVSEAEVMDVRSMVDSAVLNITLQLSARMQHARDVSNAAGLCWHHLNTYVLSALSTDSTAIRAAERSVWNGVIEVENNIKNNANKIENDIMALTAGLDEMVVDEIRMMLDNMKNVNQMNVEQLQTGRFYVVDATNAALAALQLIINELPRLVDHL